MNMKITTPKLLAQALKNARIEQNLSQQAVAERVGIKQATVSSLENYPEKSRVETLYRLLSALEIELTVSPRDRQPEATGWSDEW